MTFKPGQCGGSQHDLDGGTLRLNHAVADIKNDKWLCNKQIRIAENVKLPVSLPWTAFTPMVLRVDVRIFILLLRPMDTGEILCSTPVTEVGDFGLISCLSCPAPSWCSLHPQVEEGHLLSYQTTCHVPLGREYNTAYRCCLVHDLQPEDINLRNQVSLVFENVRLGSVRCFGGGR